MRAVLSILALAFTISLIAWGLGKENLLAKDTPLFVLTVKQGEEVPFTIATSESHPDDVPFVWDFGDGTAPVEERNPTYTYSKSGSYTATVTVTDDEGKLHNNKFAVMVEEDGSKTKTDSQIRSSASLIWSDENDSFVTGFTTAAKDSGSIEQPRVEVGDQDSYSQPSGKILGTKAQTDVSSELGRAQQILDFQILKNPILQGTKIYIQNCPNNWQGCAFYELGVIWIDPDHKQPLKEIVVHECNHIIDWRQDGDIDYNDNHN